MCIRDRGKPQDLCLSQLQIPLTLALKSGLTQAVLVFITVVVHENHHAVSMACYLAKTCAEPEAVLNAGPMAMPAEYGRRTRLEGAA